MTSSSRCAPRGQPSTFSRPIFKADETLPRTGFVREKQEEQARRISSDKMHATLTVKLRVRGDFSLGFLPEPGVLPFDGSSQRWRAVLLVQTECTADEGSAVLDGTRSLIVSPPFPPPSRQANPLFSRPASIRNDGNQLSETSLRHPKRRTDQIWRDFAHSRPFPWKPCFLPRPWPAMPGRLSSRQDGRTRCFVSSTTWRFRGPTARCRG